jgi:hypothetical protein
LLATSVRASFNFSRYILTTSISFFSCFTKKLLEKILYCNFERQVSFVYGAHLLLKVLWACRPLIWMCFQTRCCHIFYLFFVEQIAWQNHPRNVNQTVHSNTIT